MINWGIKKYKTYNNIQKIIDKYKVEIYAEQITAIEKALNKGANIYMFFNPYDSEINQKDTILYSENEQKFLNSYYTSAVEI